MTGTRLALAAMLAALLAPLAPSAEPDKYLPADATLVVHVNVRQVLDSPLGKKYAPEMISAALRQNGQVQQLLQNAGVDPLKDVDALSVAAPGASTDGAVVVVHGRIDPERFQKSAGLKIHKEGALTVYEGKHGSDAAFATFPAPGTLLLSHSRSALASAASGTARLGKDIAAVVEKVDGRQSIWAAALMPEDAKRNLAKQPQTAELAAKIRAFTVTVNVDRDVQTTVSVLTTEPKAAESIAELLESLKGLGKLYAASVPQIGAYLGQVIDTVKVVTSSTTVTATLQVSEQTIDQVIKAAQAPAAPPRKPMVPVKKKR